MGAGLLHGRVRADCGLDREHRWPLPKFIRCQHGFDAGRPPITFCGGHKRVCAGCGDGTRSGSIVGWLLVCSVPLRASPMFVLRVRVGLAYVVYDARAQRHVMVHGAVRHTHAVCARARSIT